MAVAKRKRKRQEIRERRETVTEGERRKERNYKNDDGMEGDRERERERERGGRACLVRILPVLLVFCVSGRVREGSGVRARGRGDVCVECHCLFARSFLLSLHTHVRNVEIVLQ